MSWRRRAPLSQPKAVIVRRICTWFLTFLDIDASFAAASGQGQSGLIPRIPVGAPQQHAAGAAERGSRLFDNGIRIGAETAQSRLRPAGNDAIIAVR